MNAKNLLLSTTALTLASTGMMVSMAPAHAADAVKPLGYSVDPVSGYVEAYGAFGQKSEGGDSVGYTGFGGAGRLNWWLSPSHTLQVDAYGSGFNKNVDSGGTTFALAGHYAWKMPTGNIAVMASIGQVFGERYGTLAVEGQLHGSNWTLYGQGGVTRPTENVSGPGDLNTPYAAVQGRYFFNQNFEATADLAFASLFGEEGYTRFGAGLEYKPMGMPFSIFGRGQIESFSDGGTLTSTSALFGVKLFVNQPSLWSNDVNGATYLDLNPIYGEFSTTSILD